MLLAHSSKLRALLDAADRRVDEGSKLGHEEFWGQVKERTYGQSQPFPLNCRLTSVSVQQS